MNGFEMSVLLELRTCVPEPGINQVEGMSWIYVQHVNLASFGCGPVNLRATRKFTGK